jgi:hypothetical protein
VAVLLGFAVLFGAAFWAADPREPRS